MKRRRALVVLVALVIGLVFVSNGWAPRITEYSKQTGNVGR